MGTEGRKGIGLKQNGSSHWSMGMVQKPEQPPIHLTASFRETERACLALVSTEIEVAFSFLGLAEVETSSGNAERATELIAKAVATHNRVVQYAGNMRAEFEAEKRDLCVEARKLFEAIRAAEQRRRQSGSLVIGSTEGVQA